MKKLMLLLFALLLATSALAIVDPDPDMMGMYFDVEAGGQTAAVFYSLLETCSRMGLNPQEYLADVMVRVNTHPQSRIGELTLHGWAAKNESEEKRSA